MSVLVLFDTVQRKSVMYCNDRAFGPVFDDYGADEFLDWYELRPDTPGHVRSLNNNTLDLWVATWQADIDPEPTDTQIYGAGVK